MYLDDWLLLAKSRQEDKVHTYVLLHHLHNLGSVVKEKKNRLSTAQKAVFL